MKWRLLTPHYINDALLEAGTVVGDDCQYNFNRPDGEMWSPSLNMEPADKEAEAYLKDHPRKFEDGKVPTDLLQTPSAPMPGQRIGGLGPKPSDTPVQVPGQGPGAGDAAALDRAIVEKALSAPADNLFGKK